MGKCVEIMVNNVTVILVIRDVRLSLQPLALYHVLYRVMSEVINNRASLFWLRHDCCHGQSAKQHHTSVCHKRIFAWLPINTMLCVPYRTDSDTVTVSQSNTNKGIVHINTQRNPLYSFQNNPRNQVSATFGNHANPITVCVPRKNYLTRTDPYSCRRMGCDDS